jgi:omega-amidase
MAAFVTSFIFASEIFSSPNEAENKFPEILFLIIRIPFRSSSLPETFAILCQRSGDFPSTTQRITTDIFAGLIERDHENIFNSLAHFDSYGLIRARYRKIHPYSHAGEDKSYAPGDEIVVSQIYHVNFGLSVCYDLRFPELYRLYSKQLVDVLVDIANWPVQRIEHWKTLLKARAIENQCFMIGVNRVGQDPGNSYNGCSAIFDPMGNQIIMNESDEKIIAAEIDIQSVTTTRNKLPFLKDMKLI